MDLKQLEYFVTVAEMGSFTRASIALDVAQPALSRQIRLLEVELRQNLLIRNGRGVLPTEPGRLLLEHARGVLHQLARTREALDRARDALTGHVAIGLPPSLSRALTVPLTRGFRQLLPDATLSISEGLSSTMQEALVSGRLDMALLYNSSPSPDISLCTLYDEQWQRVRALGPDEAPNPQPIALREVAKEALLIPSRPNSTRLLVEHELARLGCQPRIAVEVDSIAAILDLVADGQGSAILSQAAVAALGGGRRFECRPIVAPALSSPLSLATSARRPATPTQEAARQLLQDNVALVLRQTEPFGG